MTKLYTSSWPMLARTADHHEEFGVVGVSISCTLPRFWQASTLLPRIEWLAPRPELNRYMDRKKGILTDKGAFKADYIARLDSGGPERVLEALDAIREQYPNRDLILCCYEPDRAACHRGMFASWWLGVTGELIPEWEPPMIGSQLTMRMELSA